MDDPIEKLHNIDSEIVIGLVGALGTDLARVRDLVTEALVRIRYDVIVRKNGASDTGEKATWKPKEARPRVQMLQSTYLDLELEAANLFGQKIPRSGVE
jgi:hypothetical protein